MGEADRERARYRDFIADRGFAADPIYMADMDVCQPAQAISPQRQRCRWHTVSYETSDFAGTMLCAGPETVAPEGHLSARRYRLACRLDRDPSDERERE